MKTYPDRRDAPFAQINTPARALGTANLRYDKTSGMRMFPHVAPIPSREREEQTPRDLQFRVTDIAIIGPECRCVFTDQEPQRCKELR